MPTFQYSYFESIFQIYNSIIQKKCCSLRTTTKLGLRNKRSRQNSKIIRAWSEPSYSITAFKCSLRFQCDANVIVYWFWWSWWSRGWWQGIHWKSFWDLPSTKILGLWGYRRYWQFLRLRASFIWMQNNDLLKNITHEFSSNWRFGIQTRLFIICDQHPPRTIFEDDGALLRPNVQKIRYYWFI